MKKYLFGILAITMAVGFSAFTTKKAYKPVAVPVYYINGKADQRIETGYFFQTPATENTITQGNFTDETNWSTTANGAALWVNDGSSYVNSFTIEGPIDANSDNIPGDGISIKQAIDHVWAAKASGSNLVYPANNEVFNVDADGGSGSVTVQVTGFTMADDDH